MNGLPRETTNVNDAVRVLGVRPTIGHVLNAAMTAGMGALAKGLPTDLQIWHARRGMLVASTTSTFAKELEDRSDETAFLMGILQDVGILTLLRAFPKEYQAALKRWRSIGHLKLGAVEQAELGSTHAEISAAMMERWGMPMSFILPVLNHLQPPSNPPAPGVDASLQRAMSIAESLVDLIDAPHPTRRHVLNTMLASYGPSKKSACLRSVTNAVTKAAQAFQLLAVPLPSAEDLDKMVRSTLSESLIPADGASS